MHNKPIIRMSVGYALLGLTAIFGLVATLIGTGIVPSTGGELPLFISAVAFAAFLPLKNKLFRLLGKFGALTAFSIVTYYFIIAATMHDNNSGSIDPGTLAVSIIAFIFGLGLALATGYDIYCEYQENKDQLKGPKLFETILFFSVLGIIGTSIFVVYPGAPLMALPFIIGGILTIRKDYISRLLGLVFIGISLILSFIFLGAIAAAFNTSILGLSIFALLMSIITLLGTGLVTAMVIICFISYIKANKNNDDTNEREIEEVNTVEEGHKVHKVIVHGELANKIEHILQLKRDGTLTEEEADELIHEEIEKAKK